MTGNPHHTGPPASKPPMSALPPTAAETQRMTENPPPPAARTPGQLACEAYDLALYGTGHDPDIWASRTDREREAWQAAIAAAPELVQLRGRVAQLENRLGEVGHLEDALVLAEETIDNYREEFTRLQRERGGQL